MNVLKHMEAVFVIALAAAGTTSFVAHAVPHAAAPADSQLSASIGTPTKIAIVTVVGKRLSPVQKQRLLQLERTSWSRA